MPFEVKILPGEPVVFVNLTLPLDMQTGVAQAYAQAIGLAQSMQGPVYMVSDVSALSFNLNDVIDGMAVLRGMLPKEDRYHFIAIGSNEMVKFASSAMKQAQYGKIDILLVASLAEALALVHKDMGKPA